MLSSFCRTYADPGFDLQRPADAGVVMVTILRPAIADAVTSVFAQDLQGRIHLVIGIDKPALEDLTLLENICRQHPPNCAVTLFYPGYSTSVRHGGLHRWSDVPAPLRHRNACSIARPRPSSPSVPGGATVR